MIYLDNAATTPMDPEVIRVMTESMENDFANSGTIYKIGLDAKNRIERAQEQIMEYLCIPSGFRVVFTAGGSESNNLFIKGVGGKLMAYLGLEHPSVTGALESFKESGSTPLVLSPQNTKGHLDLSAIAVLKAHNVRMLCLSHVNNEIGSVNDPKTILPQLKEHAPQVKLFLDGAQAVGKLKFTEEHWPGLAGYSISAHKFNGPKGIGALIVDSDLPLKPQIHGGKQQYGMRAGTLPTSLIVGLTHALKLAVERVEDTGSHVTKLRDCLVAGLQEMSQRLPHLDIHFNSSLKENLQIPAIINFRFSPVEGEVLLHHLEEKQIYVGLGSACSAHSKEPSKILTGMGLSPDEARCSLRVSFGRQNTLEEVGIFLKEFERAYEVLFPTFSPKYANR